MPVNLPLLLEKHEISIFDLSLDEVNWKKILDELFAGEEQISCSHFVNRRWENSYLDSHLTPSAAGLLNWTSSLAGKKYGENFFIPSQFLGYATNEYWFNIARPGEATGRHNHKDEAIISGVFYLKVPEKSGDLKFHFDEDEESTVRSKEGRMVLFPSILNHSVDMNRSKDERISLAFNCYSSDRYRYEEQDDAYGVNKYFS